MAPRAFPPIAVALLLAVHGALLGFAATRHSPTYDEPAHLLAGLSHWELGTFDLYRVNPPLVRALGAVPVLFANRSIGWDEYQGGVFSRWEHVVARKAIATEKDRFVWFLTLARWACVSLSLWGAYVCFRFAKELYGKRAGLLALALWCFSPMMLGHGQLITPDVGAAALGITATWLFWRWLRQPETLRTVLAGLALGLAELTKFTWIVFFALWPVLWLVWRLRPGNAARPRWWAEVGQLVLILGLAIYTINVGYAFEGTGRPLDRYEFVSRALGGPEVPLGGKLATGNRFRGTWLGTLRLPLPANYIWGIDVQKRDFERGSWSYLRGRWRHGGWWYYYLYGLGVKVPVGAWALAALAVVARMMHARSPGEWREDGVVLGPAGVVLVLVSVQTGFNHHLRYVLPAFPLAYVWISRVAAAKGRRLAGLSVMALAASLASSLWAYPHSLSYFNELVGGPRQGHWHLLDSNVDWGQDLWYLNRWLKRHPEARPMRLGYFGVYPPELVGWKAVEALWGEVGMRLPRWPGGVHGPRSGWYAVSVNLLHGNVLGSQGLSEDFRWLLEFEPVASAGYSILIYHITPEEANRVRGQLGLPLLSADGRQQK